MRKCCSALICIALLIVPGCKNIREKVFPTFTFNIPEIKLRVPPIPILTGREIPVGALSAPINMDSTVRAYTGGTIGAEAVTTVKMKKVVVKAFNTTPKNNLSNFESARIVLFNDNRSVEIANIRFPNKRIDSVVVSPAHPADISDFLRGSQLQYNLYWKNRRTTNRALRLSVRLTIDVQ